MGSPRERRHGRRTERPVETFATGLAFTVVFGALLGLFNGPWWVVFPLAFVGIAPMVRGLAGMVGRRREGVEGGAAPLPPPGAAPAPADRAEKELLAAARDGGGILTPALAALKTSLSIDEAERMLQGLAGRGHAAMVVADDGRVEYHFPEFRPPPSRDE